MFTYYVYVLVCVFVYIYLCLYVCMIVCECVCVCVCNKADQCTQSMLEETDHDSFTQRLIPSFSQLQVITNALVLIRLTLPDDVTSLGVPENTALAPETSARVPESSTKTRTVKTSATVSKHPEGDAKTHN